jgi:hypothetical protein
MRMAYVAGGAVVVIGGMFGLRALDHAHAARYRAEAAELRERGITVCDFGGPMDLPPNSTRLAAVGVGVVALLSLRYLARAATR